MKQIHSLTFSLLLITQSEAQTSISLYPRSIPNILKTNTAPGQLTPTNCLSQIKKTMASTNKSLPIVCLQKNNLVHLQTTQQNHWHQVKGVQPKPQNNAVGFR